MLMALIRGICVCEYNAVGEERGREAGGERQLRTFGSLTFGLVTVKEIEKDPFIGQEETSKESVVFRNQGL